MLTVLGVLAGVDRASVVAPAASRRTNVSGSEPARDAGVWAGTQE